MKGWPTLWWASTEQIAREALAAVGRQATLAAAQPDTLYQMEVVEGGVALETRPLRAGRR